ncbi:MAG TPA: hypothetical protein DDZ19_03360, partial [Flavobacteriales bacterium]|nr:hypothetical protein [Flavobacteriales bacterium]
MTDSTPKPLSQVNATPKPIAPHKFEAGTPHISGAIGLGVALTWLNGLGG